MGQSQPKKEQQDQQNEHQRLGQLKLEAVQGDLHNTQQEEEAYIMHLKKTVQTQKMYTEWVKNMNQVSDSESKQVILLPLKHSFESVGMCGSSGIVKLSYDYYEFVLKTEINNRFRLKKDFLQTEVWYLLYNIVRAGNKFEILKKKIGNVHPQNVLINESGQIKIISTVSLPGQISNYDSVLEHQNDNHPVGVFLAPQEINNDLIQKGNYPTHVDPSLAEVFSIGLTILSSGTLEDCDSVYKQNPYEIKKDRLNSLLKVFKDKYSDYLFQTVASMVAINPQDRKRCSSIAASLYQYQPQILDLQPFQPANFRPQPRQNYSYQQPQYQQPPPQQVAHQSMYYQPQQPGAVSRGSYQVPSTIGANQPVMNSNLSGNQGVPAYYHHNKN